MVIIMYIETSLIIDFQKRYPAHHSCVLEEALEECGVWYPGVTAVRLEWDEPKATLEEICGTMYYIIKKDIIWFVNPDDLWDDIEEYMASHY